MRKTPNAEDAEDAEETKLRDSSAPAASSALGVLFQAALLDRHVLPHDEPVGGHFAQAREHAVYVLIRINKDEHHRQLAAGIHQRRRFHALPPGESAHGVEHGGAGHVLTAEI